MNLRRASVFTVVLVIHIMLLLLAHRQSRHEPSPAEPQDFVSTWITLPNDPTPRTSANLTLQQKLLPPVIPIQIEAPDIAPIAPPATDTSAAVDWMAEAHQSAIAISEPSRVRDLGHFPETVSSEAPRPPQVVHHAGESYRDSDGNHVAWVNDNCYIISEQPPLGTPDVFARMAPTRTVCKHPSVPEGELFKDMEAYKKSHPQ
jgi:hypothetical protein